jgi:putative membrane protein (TIGR04086 family)
MSDTKKFPAIGLLVVFGVGSSAAAVSLAGFGWLMVKQGLTQEAAAPIYLDSIGTVFVAAVLGPFYGMLPNLLSGLLMAILQKGKGLVWGAAEGALFAGLLFILGTLYQSEWETMQFVRAGLVLLMGVLGGILGMLRAERKRR